MTFSIFVRVHIRCKRRETQNSERHTESLVRVVGIPALYSVGP